MSEIYTIRGKRVWFDPSTGEQYPLTTVYCMSCGAPIEVFADAAHREFCDACCDELDSRWSSDGLDP